MYFICVTWGLVFVSGLGFCVFYFDILPCFMFLSSDPARSSLLMPSQVKSVNAKSSQVKSLFVFCDYFRIKQHMGS